MCVLWVFGLSRNTGDKGTLGGRWRAKLHIIKHYQNWTLGTYKIFYSVNIFVIVSSLCGDKHLLFLFFWRSVPFVLIRGVFLSTKIARNTLIACKKTFSTFLLHRATKRSVGDVWLMWGRGAMFRGQWAGLQKGVVLLTIVNRPNYRLKP